MYFRKNGQWCQLCLTYKNKEIGFFMDTYENRGIILSWLDEIIEERKKQSGVVSIFKGERPKAVLFSVQNETDRVELELTERLYLQMNIFIRNPSISKETPESVLEFLVHIYPPNIYSLLIQITSTNIAFKERLDKILSETKYKPSLPSISPSLTVVGKSALFNYGDRDTFVKEMIKTIKELSDKDLIKLWNMFEWKEEGE